MDLDFTQEIIELQNKSASEIERETAVKWAKRAMAAFFLAERALTLGDKIPYLFLGFDLRHEAFEHASLVGDQGSLLSQLQQSVDHLKDRALQSAKLPDDENVP